MNIIQMDAKPVYETTISVLKVLSEESQKKVLDFSVNLLKSDRDNPFSPKSEAELFEQIDHSLAQADAGELQDADEAIEEIMAELGL